QPLRMQGQQIDEESGLHYNRHRYYDPAQGRYISQDPIGLAGGWNPYTYPLDPIQSLDPLGLINFGTGMTNIGTAVQSAGTYLPQGEATTAIGNISSTLGAWTPGSEYLKAWSIDTPFLALTAIFGPAASVTKMFVSSFIGCGANTTYQINKGEDFNYADASWAALTSALAPGRGLIQNTLLAMGTTYLNKGDNPGAVGGAGLGTIASEVVGAIAPNFIPDPIINFIGSMTYETIGDDTETIYNAGNEK
ncbi:RHS repeat-associated core domain-containing protein, partial [Buttiauxella sp.]|uniref:RHS repeat-associated core domain-containing protein n=1 Tax=Buttiauxella sp. TaxID=1972222 RepID=UPI003C78167B